MKFTHWEDSDAGRDWGQEEKGTTEAWCAAILWGRRELDSTEQLN